MQPFADDPDQRRSFGRYYTPAALVRALHRLLAGGAAPRRASSRADARSSTRLRGRRVPRGARGARPTDGRLGLDLDPRRPGAGPRAAARAPSSSAGDAYGEGLAVALRPRCAAPGRSRSSATRPTSPTRELLKSGRYHEVRDALLPFAREVAKRHAASATTTRSSSASPIGSSSAAGGTGAIAFVTSATFVDNFLYAPMRRWLSAPLPARTRWWSWDPRSSRAPGSSTALSVWVRDAQAATGARPSATARLDGRARRAPRRASRAPSRSPAPGPIGDGAAAQRAPATRARKRSTAMRARAIPSARSSRSASRASRRASRSCWSTDDRRRLEQRMRDFFAAARPREPSPRATASPQRAAAKLAAAFAARAKTAFDRRRIRPFARYAGRPHRFRHRPRGDGLRLRRPGAHSARRPPLPRRLRSAPARPQAGLQRPRDAARRRRWSRAGCCVHDYRHARFAPLWVPEAIVRGGLAAARPGATLGKRALNLAPAWRETAQSMREPSDLLYFLSAVVNSRLVQERFAPAVGESEEIPIARLGGARVKLAQRLADAARKIAPGGSLGTEDERRVEALYGLR